MLIASLFIQHTRRIELKNRLNKNITIDTFKPKVLHEYVEAFKVYHFTDDANVFLVPKGVFEIVFQSERIFQHKTNYSSGWKVRPRNFIGGLHNQAYLVNSRSNSNSCIAVEFKANTAKYFIPEKLNYFQNSVVCLEEVWDISAKRLSNKIDNESDDSKKIDHIENFLLQQLIRPKYSSIELSLKEAFIKRGFVDVSKLCQMTPLSKAQFRKRFKEEVGTSPSQYNKILRVNHSLLKLASIEDTLTSITYSLGYYDQSHFIKDFKSIMGISPKQYKTLIA